MELIEIVPRDVKTHIIYGWVAGHQFETIGQRGDCDISETEWQTAREEILRNSPELNGVQEIVVPKGDSYSVLPNSIFLAFTDRNGAITTRTANLANDAERIGRMLIVAASDAVMKACRPEAVSPLVQRLRIPRES